MTAIELPPPPTEGPELLKQGRFAIFHKPDGGLHLTLQDEDGQEHHVDVPAFIAGMLAKGEGPFGFLGGLTT